MATVVYQPKQTSALQAFLGGAASSVDRRLQENNDPARQEKLMRLQALRDLRQQGQSYGEASGTINLQSDPMKAIELQLAAQFGPEKARAVIEQLRAQTLLQQTQAEGYPRSLDIREQYNQNWANQNAQATATRANIAGAKIQEEQTSRKEDRTMDLSDQLLKSDAALTKAIAQRRPTSSKEAKLRLQTASQKLTTIDVNLSNLDPAAGAAAVNSVINDVMEALRLFETQQDFDGQQQLMGQVIQMFKGYVKNPETKWVWDQLMTRLKAFQPIVREPGIIERLQGGVGMDTPPTTYDPTQMMNDAGGSNGQ